MNNISNIVTNFKLTKLRIGVILAALILWNSFIIVPSGSTKVGDIFGTVKMQHYSEGLHIVNPLMSFRSFDTRNARYVLSGLNIPTQDRFNSTGDITVLYRIRDELTPSIRQNYGTSAEYLDKTLRPQLENIIRDQGRKIGDSRGLAISDKVTAMQEETKTRLTELLSSHGIDIQQVLIQDIKFDSRIIDQIIATQKRIEREEAQKSQLRIAQTDAEIMQQQAMGVAAKEKEEADARAYAVISAANAEKSRLIAEGEGEAEKIKLIAAANLILNKSLTPAILEKQRQDNEAILYNRSTGAMPHTIIGSTDLRAYGVPIQTTK